MGQTIEISDAVAAKLTEQAAKRGLTVEAWIERLASERAVESEEEARQRRRAAAQGLLELRKRVKPDPEGWTIRDYIDYGRL